MSFEPGPGTPARAAEVSPSLRLQILSTEHWSLLASRSLAWNESFTRAGMFLSTLTGAIVALALVAQASAFGEGFMLFALVILPAVLFIGVATVIRMGESNYHDALCVVGMNRIRAAYLEIAPELGRYFVMGAHDDPPGLAITMGMRPAGGRMSLAHFIAGTPTVVGILNSVIAGVIVALLALRAGVGASAPIGAGVLGFLVTLLVHLCYAGRSIAKTRPTFSPLFPTPGADH